MATFLYKLGRLAFRRRHFVALIWVALLTLAGVGAASAPPAGNSSFSIPGTEAQKAFDLLEQRFPGASADGATARVVFKAPAGETMTDAGNKATVEKTVDELADGSEVASGPVDAGDRESPGEHQDDGQDEGERAADPAGGAPAASRLSGGGVLHGVLHASEGSAR